MGFSQSKEGANDPVVSYSTPNTPSKKLPPTKDTSASLFIGDARKEKIKVLFCGDNFEDGYLNTFNALRSEKNVLCMQCSSADVEKESVDAHVIVPLMTKITRNIIRHAPRLALIMQFGVGLEGVDIQAATEAGVWVAKIESTHCGNAQSCAEHAIYLALAVLRDQKAMTHSIVTGKLGEPTGRTLFQSNVLIYGFGGIGKQLAQRLSSFEVNVSVIKKTLDEMDERGILPDYVDDLGVESDFPRLAAKSDIIFLCCSQNNENFGMVNKNFISYLKPGSIIVNVARGGLINYGDVYDALESGALAGIGLDVFHTEPFPKADPLLLHPKCIATPHIAGVTKISYENMANYVANNIIRMRNGHPPLGCINEIVY